jgi:hypothetical protein
MSLEKGAKDGGGTRGYRLTVRLVTGEERLALPYPDLAVAVEVGRLCLADEQVAAVELHALPEHLLVATLRR